MPAAKLDRRGFLRGAGVALALPWFEAFAPRRLRGAEAAAVAAPRRMVMMAAPLGFHGPNFFPEQTGRDYAASPYLQPLQSLRDRFTVLSGLSHPSVGGGHAAEMSFLTAAPNSGRMAFRNSQSFDQFAAERIGHHTRFASLVLSVNGEYGLSWTRSGVRIPADSRPTELFARLFLADSPTQQQAQLRRMQDGQSIMDVVLGQTASLQRKLGERDRQTLDQYLTSVRELEQRLVKGEAWTNRPKPHVDREPPVEIVDRGDFVGRTRLMYELVHLALQTDSTRIVTLMGPSGNDVVTLEGVDDGWHNLSHHGQDPGKIEQLGRIELAEMQILAEFLESLKSTPDGEGTLLDHTTVMSGSSLGNASSHSNRNLPMLLAGGKFRHGGHLGFDPASSPPLSNLYVDLLQHAGLEVDAFADSTGTLSGLERVR